MDPCQFPNCAQSHKVQNLMDRIARIETTLHGDSTVNRQGALERLNRTEQIAQGIQNRLNQLAFMVLGLVVTAVMQLVLTKHSTQKIEQVIPPPLPTATP